MAPRFRRGQGSEALPYGAAARLNRAAPSRAAFQDEEIPIEFARDVPEEDLPKASLSEDLDILLSDPDPRYRAAAVPRDRPNRVPRYVVRHLLTLATAAKMPDAPPTLRAYYRAIVRALEAEERLGA